MKTTITKRIYLLVWVCILSIATQVKADTLPQTQDFSLALFEFRGDGYVEWANAMDRANHGHMTAYLWDSGGEQNLL